MLKKIFIFLGVIWLISVIGTYIDLYYREIENPLRKSLGISTMFISYAASAILGGYFQSRENRD